MLSRPDSQSFTRLLISAGTFLLVAAFVVPGLILRDTDLLLIPERELSRLTPTAENQIEHRQEIAGEAGDAAVYIGAFFLLCGGLLIAVGVPRLWRLEQRDDEQRRMEMAKLRGEIRPQSAEEQQERLREEIVANEAEEQRVPENGVDAELSEGRPHRRSPQARLREAADAEQAVLSRIGQIAPPLYSLESMVVVQRSHKRLLLDGLLISEVQQLPDLIVEIKYVSEGITDVGRRVREARLQLLRALGQYERPAMGWLIVVGAEEPSLSGSDALQEEMAKADPSIRLSMVGLDQLDQLILPIYTS